MRIATGGEIEIAGSVMLGYLGEPALAAVSRPGGEPGEQTWWKTGDVGTIDAEGYVHVNGRRRNVLITAYGRNVSPEWVETALTSEPVIAQFTGTSSAVLYRISPLAACRFFPSRTCEK